LSDLLTNLWDLINRGDKEAWAELVRRYARLVFTTARRVGLDAYDAEDCSQHTWLALYRNRRAIRDAGRLPAWLILTTRREAISILKRRRREISQLSDIVEPRIPVPPDEELLRLEQLDKLEHGLKHMDPRCQKLLRALFTAEETVSYRDLAKSLGISANSLGPIRARCLERLRRIMEKP
jgi:RNA polymerase sigma factor (sigma-70 family)